MVKKRIEKVLLAPDGTQACAQLGMVDRDGALFYVLDADGSSKRLNHHPMSHVMADIEAEARRESEAHAETRKKLATCCRALGSAVFDIEYMLSVGKFPRGLKSDYKQRLTRLRIKLEEVTS
ncbi:MAG: hypothetical protein IKP01_02050 [Bacteroidales bacterium]|nr:hypothetical protein [Bacteroidales bacterium]